MSEAGFKSPSIVLFDVDGTLIDSYRLYLESYRRAVEPALGFAPTREEVAGRNPSAERKFLIDWLGQKEGAAAHGRMAEHYAELHQSMCEGFYDGVREMLAGLRSAGLRIGVVTSKGRRAWETTVQHLDFGPLEVVVTEDDVELPKPDPECLHLAVARMGGSLDEAIYIGDSLGDMAAGQAAGVRTGAALWPKTEPGEAEEFRDAAGELGANWFFERPADVVRALAAWC